MEDIEIYSHNGSGFQPLVLFESWRVAILNYSERVSKENRVFRMEKHLQTDEVFVLLSGEASLITAQEDEKLHITKIIQMEPLKIYNVKKEVWHHIVMTKECSVLIVENADTGTINSEYREVEANHLFC